MTDAKLPRRWQLLLAFGAIYIIWGSTYLAIAYAIDSIPPLLMASGRFLLAGSVLYLVARMQGAPRPRLVEWRSAAILGVLFFLWGNGTVVWVEQTMPSGLVALIVAMVSVWTVLLEWVWPGGIRPSGSMLSGVALGFAGVALLVLPGQGGGAIPLGGTALLMLSTFAWALGTVWSRSLPLPSSTFLVSGMEMFAGGVALFLGGLAAGEVGAFRLSAITTTSVLAFLYLALLGSIVTFTAFAWLLRVSTPAKVSTAGYVNPVVAVFLGWIFRDELLTGRSLVASAVIVVAVVLIVTGRERTRKRVSGEAASEGAGLRVPRAAAAGSRE